MPTVVPAQVTVPADEWHVTPVALPAVTPVAPDGSDEVPPTTEVTPGVVGRGSVTPLEVTPVAPAHVGMVATEVVVPIQVPTPVAGEVAVPIPVAVPTQVAGEVAGTALTAVLALSAPHLPPAPSRCSVVTAPRRDVVVSETLVNPDDLRTPTLEARFDGACAGFDLFHRG